VSEPSEDQQLIENVVSITGGKSGRIVVTDEHGNEVPVEVRIEQTIDFGAAVAAASEACQALSHLSSEQRALAMHIAMRVCLAELVACCTCTCGEVHDEAYFFEQLFAIEQEKKLAFRAAPRPPDVA
jgi:hypothetical protein